MIIDPYRYVSSTFGGLSWDFDGVNEYIDIPDNDSLSFGNGVTDSPFSVSFWMKLDSYSTDLIIRKVNEWDVSFISNNILLRVYDTSGTSIFMYGFKKINVTHPTGSWYNVVCTYDGSGVDTGIEIYIDGVDVVATGFTSGSYTAMGNKSTNLLLSNFVNGLMADIYIYDVELTSGNVSDIYNGGTPRDERDYFSANIVSFWNATDTTDAAGGVTDEGGNNSNDGTLTNMTVAANVVSDYPP